MASQISSVQLHFTLPNSRLNFAVRVKSNKVEVKSKQVFIQVLLPETFRMEKDCHPELSSTQIKQLKGNTMIFKVRIQSIRMQTLVEKAEKKLGVNKRALESTVGFSAILWMKCQDILNASPCARRVSVCRGDGKQACDASEDQASPRAPDSQNKASD